MYRILRKVVRPRDADEAHGNVATLQRVIERERFGDRHGDVGGARENQRRGGDVPGVRHRRTGAIERGALGVPGRTAERGAHPRHVAVAGEFVLFRPVDCAVGDHRTAPEVMVRDRPGR